MKPDEPRSFRRSMSRVHTWTGLVAGWLLFAIYVTGTLSFFRNEITVWMQPELHAAKAGDDWLPKALGLLTKKAGEASQWMIDPPGPRSPVVTLFWREAETTAPGGGVHGRHGNVQRLVMDPATGAALEPRRTAGGNFFYRFHFELYGIHWRWGRWIVGVATMLMFVAIVTGVIVHRNFFKDFFTFRPARGKRSWLDGHNASGVLALPFHLVITFSGLLLLAALLMPWASDALYKGDWRAYVRDARGAGHEIAAPPESTEDRRHAGLTDLRPLYRQAEQRWPRQGVGSIVVNDPGGPQASVEIRQAGGERLSAQGGAERLRFDGVTGELLEVPAARPPTLVRSIWNVLTAVHEGRFAMPVVRWLLFLSGVLGSFMVASGLVLWWLSRRKTCDARGSTPRGHRFVEIMNVGAVAGLSLAMAAYFWANRFIPAGWSDRDEWEILSFFAVWGLAFIHAGIRRHGRAWVEQLSVGAALFLSLPVLNGLTGGTHLGHSVSRGQWQVAGFDLSAFVFGAILLFIAYRVHLYAPRSASERVATDSSGIASAVDEFP
ncbi:MAG: PepSY domain-containing protein [Candidatus Accumulibacter sp.]|jgi:uncharacterized iron-regulated membrane protein|nr:PepSY domain-containing protein [Accumulibacter sp.]